MTGIAPVIAASIVGIGGAFGAMGRHAVGLRIEGRRSVVVVNALGSFVLGVVIAAPIGSKLALFAAIGFCGAFTTFSSVTVETVSTAVDGDTGPAARFAAETLLTALFAFLIGAVVVGLVA